MHTANVKFNALQHGCQFVNECLLNLLLLQLLRAWPFSRMTIAAKQPTWAHGGRLVCNVDWRQCDIGIGDNGDAAVVDRQFISCMRLRTIHDVV